jgi:hypothetical protein
VINYKVAGEVVDVGDEADMEVDDLLGWFKGTLWLLLMLYLNVLMARIL